MKLLITGGAGFIGSNFVRYLLKKYPEYEIVVLDKLTYAGRVENLQDVTDKIKFIRGDVCDKEAVERSVKGCNGIFNFAAETHVDRSIDNASEFVKTDVLGTYILLEASRKYEIERYVQISTDEVYGQISTGHFKETDNLNPRNPYSASKAGGDLICKSFHTTYSMPVLITRSSNNYGPFQYPEKLIPVLILTALRDKPLPIYGAGKQIREWLFVRDNCEAIDLVFHKGKSGEIYNIGTQNEKRNIDTARMILKGMNKPESLITFVKDRPGHDFRYSLDFDKIKQLGWEPRVDLKDGLGMTIEWYLKNEWWWKPLLSS